MSLLKQVFNSVKEVLWSFTPNRSLYEAMMKFDFKVDDARQNLMQLSFSALANGPLFILLALLMVEPTRNSWSLIQLLQNIFGNDSQLVFFFLDGQFSSMLIVASLFFVLEWILRKEYLLIVILFYFLNKSELHLHLATAGLIGIYISRACYLWWFHIELESQTRKIWHWATSLQLVATFISVILSLSALDYFKHENYFANTISQNRSEFFISVILVFQISIFIMLSLWGHFYFKIKNDPADLPTYFSTTTWILRFKMSYFLKKKLKDKTSQQIKAHQASLDQIKELKDQGLGRAMNSIEPTLNKELGYLQLAASRLTVD
jgi:hypothetical protein